MHIIILLFSYIKLIFAFHAPKERKKKTDGNDRLNIAFDWFHSFITNLLRRWVTMSAFPYENKLRLCLDQGFVEGKEKAKFSRWFP